MRKSIVFLLLLLVKVCCRVLYRYDVEWVGEPPTDPWRDIRLAVLLNHTSLFEVLFFGCVPVALLWQLASTGVAPAAQKTMQRPILGRFIDLLMYRIVPITRQRDHTWQRVLDEISPESLVVIAPEGRMKRATGLDLEGQPMTVRGGVAEILEVLPPGRMFILYSGGLHHIQAPGQGLPKPFKTVRARFETLDIESYRAALPDESSRLKLAVVRDLEQRRNRYCTAAGE